MLKSWLGCMVNSTFKALVSVCSRGYRSFGEKFACSHVVQNSMYFLNGLWENGFSEGVVIVGIL